MYSFFILRESRNKKNNCLKKIILIFKYIVSLDLIHYILNIFSKKSNIYFSPLKEVMQYLRKMLSIESERAKNK